MNEKPFGDPAIFGLGAFGFALLTLGLVLTGIWPEAHGVLFACVIYGALAEFIAGMWHYARGETYLGAVVTVFGLWLVGLYLFQTQGVAMGAYSHAGMGLYCLALLPAIAILWIPAIKTKAHPVSAAFAALFFCVLFLGIGNASSVLAAVCDKIAGWLSIISAVTIWNLMYHHTSALWKK